MATTPKTLLPSSVMKGIAIDTQIKSSARGGVDAPQRKMAHGPARSGNLLKLPIQPQHLCTVFGVEDVDVATRLLSQLINAFHPDPATPVETSTIKQALGIIQSIGPTNATEAMTAVMMIAAEHAAMDAMRRAAHPAQTPGGRQSYTGLGLKAMRTFSLLLEALNHSRGKGVVRQEILVQHINVESGAQAVVGATTGGRG